MMTKTTISNILKTFVVMGHKNADTTSVANQLFSNATTKSESLKTTPKKFVKTMLHTNENRDKEQITARILDVKISDVTLITTYAYAATAVVYCIDLDDDLNIKSLTDDLSRIKAVGTKVFVSATAKIDTDKLNSKFNDLYEKLLSEELISTEACISLFSSDNSIQLLNGYLRKTANHIPMNELPVNLLFRTDVSTCVDIFFDSKKLDLVFESLLFKIAVLHDILMNSPPKNIIAVNTLLGGFKKDCRTLLGHTKENTKNKIIGALVAGLAVTLICGLFLTALGFAFGAQLAPVFLTTVLLTSVTVGLGTSAIVALSMFRPTQADRMVDKLSHDVNELYKFGVNKNV
jgi:hypothetical protein